MVNQLQEQIMNNQTFINKLNTKKNNTIILAQEGILDMLTTKEEINKFNLEIKNLEEEIELLQGKLNHINIDIKEQHKSFKELYDALNKTEDIETYNKILREVVKKIEIGHVKKQDVNIDIEFL